MIEAENKKMPKKSEEQKEREEETKKESQDLFSKKIKKKGT